MTALVVARRRERLADGATVARTVLTDAGLQALFEQGWVALGEALEAPQSWFVSAARDGLPLVCDARQPHVVDQRREPAGTRALLYVHPDLRCFAGHFPGRPLLPGVVQVGWAAALVERLRLCDGVLAGLSRIKFAAPVVPGDVITLALAVDGAHVDFRLETAAGLRSRGTLRYRD